MSDAAMIELWQAEWCPSSHRVRQRLTELGISFIAHQVPAEREARTALLAASGQDRIPVIRIDGQMIGDADAILAALDQRFTASAGAAAHRAKAIEKRAELATAGLD